MSRVSSSFHAYVSGSLPISAPMCSPAFHTEKAAPLGSAKTAISPASITCMPGMTTEPPAAVTFSVVAATSAVAT